MGDLHQQFQEHNGNDVGGGGGGGGDALASLLDPEDLRENDNQGLETASTITGTGIQGNTELDDDNSGDYFGGALEQLGTSGNLLHNINDDDEEEDGEDITGPFDDPFLRDTSDELIEGTHDEVLESSKALDLGHDLSSSGGGDLGGSGGGEVMSSGNGLGLLQGVSKTGHRHELHDRASPTQSGHSLVGGLVWALVVVHILLLVVLFAAWWRQRKSKDPTMRSLTPGPPQKVGCSYDMDKSFSMPKIELGNLPIKALKTLKQAKA